MYVFDFKRKVSNIFNMNFVLLNIYSIFFMAFFANSLVAYGFFPARSTIATEILIWILLIYSFLIKGKNKKPIYLHLFILAILFCISALFSAVINGNFNIQSLLSIRLFIRFYILYFALINLDLTSSQIKKIINFIVLLFLIQLPAIAIKFTYLGVSEETIGTYGVKGGGLTVPLPIIAISFLIGRYLFYNRKIIYLFLCIFFIAQGIVGGKAALLFLFPFSFLVYYFLYKKDRGFNFPSDLYMPIIIIIVSVICGSVIIKYQPRMNRERQVGGSVNLSHALKYSQGYTTGYNEEEGVSTGRLSTTKLIFSELSKSGFGNFIFGFGPGSLTKSSFGSSKDLRTDRIMRCYGITGLGFYMTEYGFIGSLIAIIILFSFSRLTYKHYCMETDPYWKSISFCITVTSGLSLFLYLFYNNLPLNDDLLPLLFYFAVSISHIRFNHYIKSATL